MKTLDTSKPYGTIHGDVHGRCFEQDGVHFNSDGAAWTPDQSPVGVDNAEAALRARIEKDVRAKVEAEMRAKVEGEVRAKVEAEAKAKADADAAARAKAAADTGSTSSSSTSTASTTSAGAAEDQVSQQLNESGTPLETLGLSAKGISALRGAKIESVEALAACTETQLIALPNIGPAAVKVIKQALKNAGKKLAAG